MFYNTVLRSHFHSQYAGLHVSPTFSSFQTTCQTLLQTTRPLSNTSFLHEDQPLFSVRVSLAFLPKTLFALICLHTHADRHIYTHTNSGGCLCSWFCLLLALALISVSVSFVFFEANFFVTKHFVTSAL